MSEKSVYDQIKKQNGEAFAQEIRRFHNGIFELPNLKNMLKFAGRDAKPILEYLLFLKQKSENKNTTEEILAEDPFELLEKAGYTAYVANTLQKQNAIRKYFAKGEELCTFHDAKRFQKYYIINAIKENVDQIKRENFPHPKRQDEYGTSVISIQILKTGGFISIKNRYNHTVNNPDNTFNSNPDNIIPGLRKALEHYFNIRFTHSHALDLPDNYIMLNNQLIHYTAEWQGFYFGDYYYVKDDVLHELNQDYQIMADNFIIDLKNKKVFSPLSYLNDSFPEVLNAELQGKKLTLTRDKENNHYLFADNVQLMKINSKHKITELYLPTTKEIPDWCLMYNKTLEKFSAPNVLYINDKFLYHNKECHSLYLPKVLVIGNSCLHDNTKLSGLDLPSVQEIGNFFLYWNENCTFVNLPNVQIIGCDFLNCNHLLKELNVPKLEIIGNGFLEHNEKMEKIDLPSAHQIWNRFLYHNEICTSVNLPNVQTIEASFLNNNKALEKIDLPSVQRIGDRFLYNNEICTSVNLPNVQTIGNCFLYNHKTLEKIDLPSVQRIGDDFLYENENCTSVNLPNVQKIGRLFLEDNKKFVNLSIKQLREQLREMMTAKMERLNRWDPFLFPYVRRNQNERS